MPFQNLDLSKEDFDDCDWQSIPEQSKKMTCGDYHVKYFSLAKEAKENGENIKSEIFTIFGAITSLMLQPDNREVPLGPIAVFQTSRSAIIEDFPENYIDLFAEILCEITDCELRARIGDFLWVRNRNYQAVVIAIDAYLESAERVEDPEKWTDAERRIRRAIRLAVSLGRGNIHFPKVIERIEKILEKYNGEDPLYYTSRLMGLLLDYREGDPQKYLEYSEHAAIVSESRNDFKRARVFWEHNEIWCFLGKDEEKSRLAKISAAETHVKEADLFLSKDPPDFIVASSCLQFAVEAYKRIGEMQEKVDVIYSKLLDVQKEGANNLKEYSESIDLVDHAKNAMESMKGLNFRDGIIALANCAYPPKKIPLREMVENLMGDNILTYLIPMNIVDGEGRIIARRPPINIDDEEETENVIRSEMFVQARKFQEIYAAGLIEPSRWQLNQDHDFGFKDLDFLVLNNPFIPPNREMIFARGLYEGLRGDFLIAVHLLIPQIENSIRYLLEQTGIITSSLSHEKIQEDYTLGKLLYMDELKKIFGEDLLFDLKGLLVDKFGFNLRNRIAHGLIASQELSLHAIEYFWWLVLRICVIPMVPRSQTAEDKGENDN